MKLARMAYSGLNRLLARANLRLEATGLDFDARLDRPEQLQRMFAALGAEADAWLARQPLFTVRRELDCAREIESFFAHYLASPYRSRFGGSRFNNLAWLYLVAKAYQPSLVIDSGTYTGASAWALALATPSVPILSFDIDLSQLAHRSDGVTYLETDWSAFDFKNYDLSRSFAYFDDHVDQARRLLECAERSVALAVFDDDFPVTAFAPMAHGGAALPKVEFVLDEELRKVDELSWIERGQRRVWRVPHEQLDRAKAVIARTERLPDTSLITGIHQTPYRLVTFQSQA